MEFIVPKIIFSFSFRLGLERADTAEKALSVIVDLLEKYGQGGNCMESNMAFTYYNSFLIADRKEAWVLETSGKYWAAEKVEGKDDALCSKHFKCYDPLEFSSFHLPFH